MADVAAKDVAALRKATGAGMMDCKKALIEADGDMAAAQDWLREHNLAGASKRAGRSADQGAVEVIVDGGVGAVAELTCETDFVAKSEDFQELLSAMAESIVASDTDDLGGARYGDVTFGDAVQQLSGKLGEKIEIGRSARFAAPDDGIVDGYRHIQADRGVIGVLVELVGVDPEDDRVREVAHDVALHVANSAPRYLTRDDVPEDVIAKERELFENLTRNEGKPEQAIPKIVDGRMNGFFKEQVLLEQPFVKDPKTTVADLVTSLGEKSSVRRFRRIKVGDED